MILAHIYFRELEKNLEFCQILFKSFFTLYNAKKTKAIVLTKE